MQLNNLSDLIPPVITCEHTVSQSNNWRVHEQLLQRFASFVKCFTSDQIYYKFVPVLFDVLHRNVSDVLEFSFRLEIFLFGDSPRFSRHYTLVPFQHVLPVTHAAAYTLCIFIKNNTRSEQRDELCCRFIEGMYGI